MTLLSRRNVLQASAAGALAVAAAAKAGAQEKMEPAPATRPRPEPPIRTRMFWTWDHSTEWALNRPGAQTLGASNHYGRTADVFVQDYTNLLTWCGRHGIDAHRAADGRPAN